MYRLKTGAMLMVLAAVLLLLAGCGAKGTPGLVSSPQAAVLAKTWPEFKTPHGAEIHCFEMGWTGPVAEKDFVTPEIFARTNFQLVYKSLTVASSDELNQKLNLMVASRDVPPIYFGGADDYSLSIYEKLGAANLIWDVSKLVTKYANAYAVLKPELLKYRIGGKNYYVPTQTGRGFDFLHGAVGGVFVREDFLKRLNLDYPKTYDEFYTYLKRCLNEIKTLKGQPLIGYTCGESFASLNTLIAGFWSVYRGSDFRTGGFQFDAQNGYKMVNEMYAASPSTMNYAKYLNKLYREGLIDKEILTHKNVQYEEKVSSGRVAALGCNPWWVMATLSDNARAIVPELLYVTPPDLKDAAHGMPSTIEKWSYSISMPSTLTFSKKLDEATVKHFLALLDYLATVDGQLLVNWGVEGKSYAKDANGKVAFTEQFKKDTDGVDWNKASSFGVYYWQQLMQNSSILVPFIGQFPELVREDTRKSWENKKGQRDLFDPNLPLTKDLFYTTGPVELELMPALNEAYIQFLVKVFQAKNEADVEKVVADWGATCTEIGIDKIIAEREQRIQAIKLE